MEKRTSGWGVEEDCAAYHHVQEGAIRQRHADASREEKGFGKLRLALHGLSFRAGLMIHHLSQAGHRKGAPDRVPPKSDETGRGFARMITRHATIREHPRESASA